MHPSGELHRPPVAPVTTVAPMVNSDKRQRHKSGHRELVEAQRQADARARRNRTLAIAVALVVLVVVGTVVVSKLGDDDSTVVATDATSTTVTTPDTATTLSPETTAPASGTPTVSVPSPAAGASITGDTPCPEADGSSKRTTTFAKAPPTCIDASKTYTANVTTSEGPIVIALDAKMSPVAVNNFVVLSRYHFYDGDPFHRIVPGFVDQTGSFGPDLGSGGPGYDLPEEKPTRQYAAGDVAMAASSAGPSGSQLFFTIDPAPLNSSPNYPILGRVTTGQDTVERINAFGDTASDGVPTKLVTITSITITET